MEDVKPRVEATRVSTRSKRQRTVEIDGFTVIRENNYDLLEGEPSFKSKLEKDALFATLSSSQFKKQKRTPKIVKVANSENQTSRKKASIKRVRNAEVVADIEESKHTMWRFMARRKGILDSFLPKEISLKLNSILQTEGLSEAGRAFEDLKEADQPSQITGTMRPYQKIGLGWITSRYNQGVSCILADEMGLGKTLQTIAFLAHLTFDRSISGPHLIIVPLSVLAAWMDELRRWCPLLRVLQIHARSNDATETANLRCRLANVSSYDVCVTTYEIVKSSSFANVLRRIVWRTLILDEGHRAKNEKSLISRVLRLYRSRFVLILTGTPVQNNLHELWAILNILFPEVFTSSDSFDNCFELSSAVPVVNRPMLEQAHYMLRPFMLRRLKKEVEKLLPNKLETTILVPLSEMQLFWYKRLLLHDFGLLQLVEESCQEKTGSSSDVNGVSGNQWQRLQNLIAKLRKACDHPFLFPGAETTPSWQAATPEIVSASSKMQLLDRMFEKLSSRGHRVVVFSQFTKMLDLIDDWLSSTGRYKYVRLDGSTNRIQRKINIDCFNAPNSEIFCFLMSTRSGSLGINLQSADTVIIFDSDWNPQIDLQAMARVHRIGQSKPVHVYRLVSAGTVEERIFHHAQKKLFLDSMVNRDSTMRAKDLDHDMTRMDKAAVLAALKFGALIEDEVLLNE